MKSLLIEVARGAGERRRAKRAARVAGISVVVLALAGVKLLMHLATTGAFGYGFFVDELYFLACALHLDWGFVDMPPLFPLITAAARALLGDSLLAVRVVPMLAGAGLIVLTGLITRDLGGGRAAQGLASLAVLAAPIYMLAHGVHTMNALDPLFWMGCAWALIRRIRDDQPRWWLLFGALAGLGSLNKHSMLFFGVAVAAGVVLTRLRRDLSERWIWLGALLALAVFLPNLVWLIAHGFPHLEHLASIRADGRDVAMNPALFMAQQALMLNPVSLPLWLGGLAWLLFDVRGAVHRALGLAYLALLAEMFLMDGRVYYTAPFYPLLFAAGGVAVEAWTARRPGGARRWRAALVGLLVVSGLVLAPAALPCLPPELFVRYAEATGINQPRVENHRLGPLPQLFADRFGWPEMTEVVARAFHGLSQEEQARTAIFGQNYGQAGAIDLFGPRLGLPGAVSGHLAYHDWGPRGYTGEIVLVMDDDRETLEGLFESVEKVGEVRHPYSMPYEQFDVYLCRGLRRPLAEVWPGLRRLG